MIDSRHNHERPAAGAGGRPACLQLDDTRAFEYGALRRAATIAAMLLLLLIGTAGQVSAETGRTNADRLRVLVVVPHRQDISPTMSGMGTIEAQIESAIGFQTGGRITERLVEVGQHVVTGQVLARLDPTQQQEDVAIAEATLNSAKAQLKEAQITFSRSANLVTGAFTSRAAYDQAAAALHNAQAQVTAAEASLQSAIEVLSYTVLRAGQDGIIVDRKAEAGQVVVQGQVVFIFARDGPRDAVFQVPEEAVLYPPTDKQVDLSLQANSAITAVGEVREISPVLDQSSGTVLVKVGIAHTPAGMTLGAAVVGHGRWAQRPGWVIPWSALYEDRGKPAVWILDQDNRVSLRPVVIDEYLTGRVVLSSGVKDGERVVATGIQWLYPGRRVDVAGLDMAGYR